MSFILPLWEKKIRIRLQTGKKIDNLEPTKATFLLKKTLQHSKEMRQRWLFWQ